MRDELNTMLKNRKADYLEIRLEESESTRLVYRGPRLEEAARGSSVGGNVRALVNGGWGFVSFNDAGNLEQKIELAINLILNGSKLIGTNSDISGPVENGIAPSTKALIAPIEIVSGKKAYYIGKPNPLKMRIALKKLGLQRIDTIVIGDRMDTDVRCGLEAEIDTLLVLSGITSREDIDRYPYRPQYILDGIIDLVI